MTSPLGLYRLAWRPYTLLMLWFVLMAAGWPLARLEELGGNPFVHLLSVRDLALVESARWQLVVLLPAAVGLLLAMIRVEVAGSGLAWMLPGIRRQWLAGEMLAVAPLAVGAALVTGFDRGALLPLAAAGTALVAWNLPGVILHDATPRWWRYGAFVLLVTAAALPAQLARVAAAAPAMLAVATLAGGTALLLRRHGARTARGAIAWGSAAVWETGMAKWFSARGEWRGVLASDRLAPWLRAVFYEMGFGSVARMLRRRAVSAVFLVVMTYALMDRTMLLFWVGMVAGDAALGAFRTGLLYPISRPQRARILAGALLLDSLLVCTLLIGGTVLIEALPLPWSPSRFGEGDVPGLGLITLVTVTLLPIAMFGGIRSTTRTQMLPGASTKWLTDAWLFVLAFVIIGSAVVRPLDRAWTSGMESVVLLGLVLTAVVLYSGFWYGTLRHYRRRDLMMAG